MLSLRPRRPKASGDDDNASFARAVSDNYWCIIGFAGRAECERSPASHSRLVLDASSARNAAFAPTTTCISATSRESRATSGQTVQTICEPVLVIQRP